MNNIDDIKKLIDKYLEGETTNGEERALTEYFECNAVPDDLVPFKDMFSDLSQPNNCSDDKAIDAFFEENCIEKKRVRVRRIPLLVRIAVMAASVVSVFLAGYSWHTPSVYEPICSRNTSKQKNSIRIVAVDRVVHDTVRVMRIQKVQQQISAKSQKYEKESSPSLTDMATMLPTKQMPDRSEAETTQNIDNENASLSLNLLPY